MVRTMGNLAARRRSTLPFAAAILGCLLLTAGCGDDADGAQGTPAPGDGTAGAAGAPGRPPPAVPQERLDAFVADWVAEHADLTATSGISIAVASADDLRTAAAGRAGTADVPVTPDTWMHIGSLTKTYTATALLHLADAGRVDLDAPVATWVPDAPAAATTTVRQLLDMTARLPEYVGTPAWYSAIRDDPARRWSLAEVRTLVPEEPVAPGPWVYCNTCYIVAGQVLEAVTGGDYHVALRAQVLEPLGLRDTDVTGEGHVVAGGTLLLDDSSPPLATSTLGSYLSIESTAATAGAMVATAAVDVARFGRALLSGGALSEARWRQMQAYTPGSIYGLGLADFAAPAAAPEASLDALGNYGEISGYTAALLLFREPALVVVVMTNDDRAPSFELATQLGRALRTETDR
jgi:D-alanyl-D-alanine carboxypeptidase